MKKIRLITETAVMLALLIVLQWVTKPLGQLVTGSCVNTVLAVSVLFTGLGSGITIAMISPVFAYLLGIAPQLVTVPPIMIGNTVFVILLCLLISNGNSSWKKVIAWLTAAAAKYLVLNFLVATIICGLASGTLMNMGVLKAPMLEMLPVMFSLPQLYTALIGGGLALVIVPMLKKALHRS